MSATKIGWIGAGNLGMPICRHLLEEGHDLCVCDVSAGPVAELAKLGARTAPSPAETAQDNEFVFSTLPTDRALLDVAVGKNGLAGSIGRGQVYVDMSTVSPKTSAEVAALLVPTGADYLRATVSGSTANAASGTLAIFCSGPEGAYVRCLPILEKIGNRVSHEGPGEEARVLKLLVNLIVIATPMLVGEALAMGRQSGLDWERMIDAIDRSVAGSPVIHYKADMMKRRDWTAMATIDLTAKDIGLALDWGRENGVPMHFADLVRRITADFQAAGEGDKDFFYTLTWPERIMATNDNEPTKDET